MPDVSTTYVNEQLSKAAALGHHLSAPVPMRKNGKRILMYGCENCDATVLATEHAATGSALLQACKQPQATVAPVQPSNRPTLTLPASIKPCEYCGNGSTIVGKSCRVCGQSRELTEKQPRRYRPTQGMFDEVPGAPVWPSSLTSERRPYRYALTEQGAFAAPCGTITKYRAVYLPTDERLSQTTIGLIRYGCECNCQAYDYLDGLTPNEMRQAQRSQFQKQVDVTPEQRKIERRMYRVAQIVVALGTLATNEPQP